MEALIAVALVMIWIVLAVIMWMSYLGYDVMSRGFKTSGPAAAALPMLGITFRDYFSKRDTHPVIDGSFVPKARFCKIIAIVITLMIPVIIVLMIFI